MPGYDYTPRRDRDRQQYRWAMKQLTKPWHIPFCSSDHCSSRCAASTYRRVRHSSELSLHVPAEQRRCVPVVPRSGDIVLLRSRKNVLGCSDHCAPLIGVGNDIIHISLFPGQGDHPSALRALGRIDRPRSGERGACSARRHESGDNANTGLCGHLRADSYYWTAADALVLVDGCEPYTITAVLPS